MERLTVELERREQKREVRLSLGRVGTGVGISACVCSTGTVRLYRGNVHGCTQARRLAQELAAQQERAKVDAAAAAAWRINPTNCATQVQRIYRGYRCRSQLTRAALAERLAKAEADEWEQHAMLFGVIGTLGDSRWDRHAVLPHEERARGRESERELLLRRFAGRFRANRLRNCFLALLNHARVERKVRRYDWAATVIQAGWRGKQVRKKHNSWRRRGGKRTLRAKDASADMLLLRAATAGDGDSAAAVLKREAARGAAGASAGIKGRFRLDPGKFRRGAAQGGEVVDAEAAQLAKAEARFKKCVARLAAENLAYCFERWCSFFRWVQARALAAVNAASMAAYEKATKEMEQGECIHSPPMPAVRVQGLWPVVSTRKETNAGSSDPQHMTRTQVMMHSIATAVPLSVRGRVRCSHRRVRGGCCQLRAGHQGRSPGPVGVLVSERPLLRPLRGGRGWAGRLHVRHRVGDVTTLQRAR